MRFLNYTFTFNYKPKRMKSRIFCLIIASCFVSATSRAQSKTLNDYLAHAPFKMPAIAEPVFKSVVYNIKDYGAVGDGQTLNTAAFEKAIMACSSAGGGVVLVPAGLWLTGPIEFQSNVNLHTERGALVIFSTDHSLYPILMPEGKPASPIYGNKLENIAVTGEGIFDGGGDTWRPLKKTKAAPTLWSELTKSGGVVSSDGSMYWPTRQAIEGEEYLKKLKGKKGSTANDYLPARDFMRPTLLLITNSNHVLIDGPTFKNSPMYVINPRFCSNLIIRNVTVNNEYYAQNGDGIDLSSCRNAIVFHCTVNAGDDGICMKSSHAGSKDAGDEALQNVIIAECIVYHAHGGFVIGSNTDGGMRNVYVTNCDFVNTDIGIRIKSARGRGGLVHDIYIDNVYMHDILNEAILFSTYYEDDKKLKNVEVNERTPRFRDFYISNIFCNNAKTAISITGLPEMAVSSIHFSDMAISARGAVIATEAADISLKNVKIHSPIPTLVTLNNARNFTFDNIGYDKNTITLISASGEKTKSINVINTPTANLLKRVIVNDGASKDAITIKE
jgi:polygalacturonase